MTKSLFITDLIKLALITTIINPLLIWLFVSIINTCGAYYQVVMVFAYFLVIILIIVLAPHLILPLFYKLDPLEDENGLK